MTYRSPLSPVLSGLALAAAGGLLAPAPALACGCFAPPDPSVPIVQAGERIVFAEDNGQVIAHIQIQYNAAAGKQFGWLLPLPGIPVNANGESGKIDIGVDELFSALTTATQPKYELTVKYDNCGNRGGNTAFGSGDAGGSPPAAPGPGKDGGPLIAQNTVGPYMTAVLDGSDKQAMLDWLSANGYIVPANTDTVVSHYINPGAVFLALKLRAGYSAGDIQPVVLRYPSALPMIPIILTSVAATRNMGVQVWMLGAGRAIPRNYYHTVINDAQIDWFSAGKNYNNVIIAAVGESTGHHSFVTEFAGSSGVMKGVLDRPGRFAQAAALPSITDPVAFVRAVLNDGFVVNGQLTGLLGTYLPLPQKLAAMSVTPAQFYQQIETFLADPSQFSDLQPFLAAFDPVKVSADLNTLIVQPTLAAGKLFSDFAYLTRLYTTLSPEDMNKDPVFSYNPSLPNYSNVHTGTLTYHCGGLFNNYGGYTSATLVTEQGWNFNYATSQLGSFQQPAVPYSERIETLNDVGPPTVVLDNTALLQSKLSAGGCSITAALTASRALGGAGAAPVGLILGSLALLLRRRRARP